MNKYLRIALDAASVCAAPPAVIVPERSVSVPGLGTTSTSWGEAFGVAPPDGATLRVLACLSRMFPAESMMMSS